MSAKTCYKPRIAKRIIEPPAITSCLDMNVIEVPIASLNLTNSIFKKTALVIKPE